MFVNRLGLVGSSR